MKFVFFFLSLLLLNVSLSFQNQDKTDTVNENEEKGYQIIKGYNYNSNKTGYTAEIEKEPVLCTTNLIPGLNMMKRGVDLNKFDFFLFGDQSKNGVNRFADSVFEFTCNNKNKWQHNKINHTYDFPDEIQSLRDLSTGKLNTKFSLKKSLIKTKEELAIQAGLESDYAGFGFSTSETYKQAKECLTEKKSFMALTIAEEKAYEIELSDQRKFSRRFLSVLNKLPAKYEDSPNEYQKFFDNFGTHYFAIGQFGGNVVLKTKINKSFLEEKTTKDIKGMLEAKFKKLLGLVNNKEKKLNEEFNKQSSSQLYYFGGYKNMTEKELFEKWIKSLPLKPWLISGKLKPIYEVIPDTKKAEQIKIAMNVALARAEIIDIQKSINFLNKQTFTVFKNAEIDLENAQKFFDKTQKKFSFKEIEKHMQNLTKLMKIISNALESKF